MEEYIPKDIRELIKNYSSPILGKLPKENLVNLVKSIKFTDDISGWDFTHADLSDTDLSNVNLSYSNLSYVNFNNTSLIGANIANANVKNANFDGANIMLMKLDNTINNDTLINKMLDDILKGR